MILPGLVSDFTFSQLSNATEIVDQTIEEARMIDGSRKNFYEFADSFEAIKLIWKKSNV